MVKEIEKAGIPVAHITNMFPVAKGIGSPRIVPGVAIKHPCSNPGLPLEEEHALERSYMERALKAISTPITEQTFF